MRIGLLLPSVSTSKRYSKGLIFAPLYPVVTLANALVKEGHQVYVYASRDVKTKAHVVGGDRTLVNTDPIYYQLRNKDSAEQKYTTREVIKRDFENDLTMRAYKDALEGKIDIIHSHDFAAHYFEAITNVPTVYTLHDPLPKDKDTIEYHRLSKFKNHRYISISDAQRRGSVKLNFVRTVHHGVDLKEFTFNNSPDNYFIYFGRLIPDKGPDMAIAAARAVNTPLHIATSPSKKNRASTYYTNKIEPYLDNKQVVHRGYLQGKKKIAYIKKAKAFIFPLHWDEPFGLVIIEAMACGTPVVAFNRGSAPELIKDGVTGYIVDHKKGLPGIIAALKKIDQIDRRKCREWVEKRFSVQKNAEDHLAVYKEVLHTGYR